MRSSNDGMKKDDDGIYENYTDDLAENGARAWVDYRTTTNKDKRLNRGEDSILMGKIEDDLSQLSAASNLVKAEVINQALYNTIKKIQNDVKNNEGGNTLVGGFIFDDQVYLFNVGDSLAFAKKSGKPLMPLNKIHDVKNTDELKRVKNLGGDIYNGRVGRLQMTRSIGPYAIQGKSEIIGVTWEPEFSQFPLTEVKQLMFASDGIEKVSAGQKYWQQYLENSDDLQHSVEKMNGEKSYPPSAQDDTTVIIVDNPTLQDSKFFAVCDGHGGKDTSYHIRDNFGKYFKQELKNAWENQLTKLNPKKVELSKENQLLTNTKEFVQQIPSLYQELHPVTGKTSKKVTGEMAAFINKFNSINSLEDKSDAYKIISLVNLVADEFNRLQVAYEKNHRPISEEGFIAKLNVEKKEHHYTRLVGLLLKHLNAELATRAVTNNTLNENALKYETGIKTIEKGSRSTFANFATLFKDNKLSPYDKIEKWLPESKETPKTRVEHH